MEGGESGAIVRSLASIGILLVVLLVSTCNIVSVGPGKPHEKDVTKSFALYTLFASKEL